VIAEPAEHVNPTSPTGPDFFDFRGFGIAQAIDLAGGGFGKRL
jgi:hypothetical protein